MVLECAKDGMKPVCEHRAYCLNDKKSIFIGQTHHLSHPSHLNNAGYYPKGFAPIKDAWRGLCNYAAKVQGGGNALCNQPINSHSWQGVGYNPGFMCGRGAQFGASLGGKNGVVSAEYTFEKARLASKSGTYSDGMRKVCKSLGMKPVCDHPSYCRNDGLGLYLGQSGHLSHPSHRDNNNYSPPGLKAIRAKMVGLCFYANAAASARGLCNIPSATHSWRTPGQANPGFLCGRKTGLQFYGNLGSRNGNAPTKYFFQIMKLTAKSGKYSNQMIAHCSKIGMKPVCEHRSYCKNDVDSIYIGQDHHLSHPSHRLNNKYFPSGWNEIKTNFNGLCYYAAKVQGGGNALCNKPSNSHSWQGTGYNPGFPCGRRASITAALGGRLGAKKRNWQFEVVYLTSKSGKYKDLMIKRCKAYGMKPICEHRAYCLNDKNSVFLGQHAHISHPSHRRINSWFPSGWADVSKEFDGLCFYAGNAASARALCNIPSNSHSWRTPGQANPGFMCAKGKTYTASLVGKNGVGAKDYSFEITYLTSKRGTYSVLMRAACKTLGKQMKPVCDHPSYCRNDKLSLYLGQSGHISHPSHRYNNNYSPKGFDQVRNEFLGLCVYANNAAGARGLCNIPTQTHSWRYPAQANPGFMCGQEDKRVFGITFGARGGVKKTKYVFQIVKLTSKSGKYADLMIKRCKTYAMKPICEHPSYCKNDKKSLYIGQHAHISHPSHRRINSWFPAGWADVSKNWAGLCNYAAKVQGGGNALCNLPSNSHSWQGPAGYNPGFMCGQTAGPCKNTQVSNSNYAKKGSLRGVGGDERKVVCKTGFSGSGISTCVSGKFTAINCRPLPCKNTQFANSNYKKTGSARGSFGTKLTVKCDKNYVGGGTITCNHGRKDGGSTSHVLAFTGTKCFSKNDLKGVCGGSGGGGGGGGKETACQKADADGNKKVNIEDLLILLGQYGVRALFFISTIPSWLRS